MEANEAHELQEHAEHAAHSDSLRPVALTMTLLAVLVAVVTVQGHRTHTDAVLSQAKASDMWNEYQAKKIRAYNAGLATKLIKVLAVADKDEAQKDVKEWGDYQVKSADDQEKEKKVAEGFQEKVELAEHRANYFDLGEVLLEIGLVITSITLLTKSRIYWYLGLGFSVIGVVASVMGLLLK